MLNPSPVAKELIEAAGDTLTMHQLVNAFSATHPEHGSKDCRLCVAIRAARESLKLSDAYWASNSETIRPRSSR